MMAMTHDEMRERVAALKHDLGKYVAWTSANLEESDWSDPPGEDLLDALRRDVLATRTREGKPEPAWRVWERLTVDLDGLSSIPELVDVERAVAVLQQTGPALEAGDPDALTGQVQRIRDAQQEIRGRLRDLHRRLAREGS
jgi:hypothetical protein